MAFTQEKIDRSADQARGIFNKYVYRTADTIAEVQAAGYFAACRFATSDGPSTNSNGWHQGVIECHCSDGYLIGVMDGATNTLEGSFSAPTVISQQDFLLSADTSDQVPGAAGVPLQITLGPAQSTPQFDLAADGALTCNITGQYRFIFTAQAGRKNEAGVVNLFLRLLKNGVQEGNSVAAKMDNVDMVVPLRFNLTLDLVAGDILIGQVLLDASGIVGAGGLYTVNSTEPGWLNSPSASVAISQLQTVV
jgi:hypothetical protein